MHRACGVSSFACIATVQPVILEVDLHGAKQIMCHPCGAHSAAAARIDDFNRLLTVDDDQKALQPVAGVFGGGVNEIAELLNHVYDLRITECGGHLAFLPALGSLTATTARLAEVKLAGM